MYRDKKVLGGSFGANVTKSNASHVLVNGHKLSTIPAFESNLK